MDVDRKAPSLASLSWRWQFLGVFHGTKGTASVPCRHGLPLVDYNLNGVPASNSLTLSLYY